MSHTLLTFIGGAGRPAQGKHRPANYDFGDGPAVAAQFFGLAVLQHLRGRASGATSDAGDQRQDRRAAPDRIVVFGTTGSAWDGLIDAVMPDGRMLDERLVLCEAVERNEVASVQLDVLAPHLTATLGLEVRLVLIPYALDLPEQIEVLRLLSEAVTPGEHVTIDITHGLRNLPFMALLAAQWLEAARAATVSAIYYGALECTPRNGEDRPLTPVSRLDGLLRLAGWVRALSTFDKDGDYAVFAPLLQDDGLPETAARKLRQAAFFEDISDFGQARRDLNDVARRLHPEQLGSTTRLALPALQTRLSLALSNSLYGQQRSLAVHHLRHGDFVRAALIGLEAFVTRLAEHQGLDSGSREGREQARADYRADAKAIKATRPRTPAIREWLDLYDRFCWLDAFRNNLAHVPGIERQQPEVLRALSSPDDARRSLETWFAMLLPEEGGPLPLPGGGSVK